MGLAACGDARHEPVRVIAQPRAEAAPVAALPPPVVPASAPAPVVAAAPASAAPPARGLDAAPRPGLVSSTPVQRAWQPGQPNGNADFRAALEARQNTRGQPSAQP
jgi:hypothetical protein